MSPEMVDTVKAQLRALYDKHAGYGRRSTYHCEPVLAAQAAWVLALAERASRETLVLKHLSDVQWETGRVGSSSEDVVKAAVQRAVEGA